MPTQRRSDTPEFAKILEADFAKANRELAALELAVKALTTENANLRHEVFAKDQELAELRKRVEAA